MERDEQPFSLCFSDLTDAEQQIFLDCLDQEGLQRICKLLAGELRAMVNHFDIAREYGFDDGET